MSGVTNIVEASGCSGISVATPEGSHGAEPLKPFWLDGRPRIGIHTSTAGEASRALETAARIGCTALQIFSGSPRMWPREHQREVRAPVAKRFREKRETLRLGPVAVHASYLINLASADPMIRERSVAAFRDEMVRALQLGAEYLIVHPGSARDAGIERGIRNVAEGIAGASQGVPEQYAAGLARGELRVLIENTAGQGTGLGGEFAHLRGIAERCRELGVLPEPGVCLDTAHLLAAGFEIRTGEGLERMLEEAEEAFGLENVRVMHMNDSKAPLGSKRDRHEHIGHGHIGKEAFARILAHPRLRSPERAFLAETPIDRPGDDRRNVEAMWRLLAIEAPVQKGAGGNRVRLDMSRPRKKGDARRKARKRAAHGARRTAAGRKR